MIKKLIKKAVFPFVCVAFSCLLLVLSVNAIVLLRTHERIIPAEAAASLDNVDCILVLGCLVKKDGVPSHMLEDRLTVGCELYLDGAAPKLLMTGDHGRTEYNEVGTMKAHATSLGIPSSDVFMDHAGFSTYESLYRAKEIFGADKIIIVTQKYHLSRALYIADKLGIEAYGVSADLRPYSNQIYRDVREMLARLKDVALTITKPEPTYLGDKIPIDGDGNVTNDY